MASIKLCVSESWSELIAFLNGFHVREDESGRETARRLVRRASSQSERFCTALAKQVSESRGWLQGSSS